jgi:hypothetical protein
VTTNPRLTPLRALALLQEVERARVHNDAQPHGFGKVTVTIILDHVRDALAGHVRAALARRRK